MTIDNDDLLNRIMESIDKIQHIKVEDIPAIDLYMDQVTTFMDSKLKYIRRNPEEDKVLTKTMINNYAKNDLLPPPVKKKYSREHVIMLIFIYYYKGILSIGDIQTLLRPLTENYFQSKSGMNMEDVYEEVFSLEKEQIESLKEDIAAKFKAAQKTFTNIDSEEKDFLQLFSFIGFLSFDVYLKKLLIEVMVDSLGALEEKESNGKKDHPKKKTGEKKETSEKEN